VAPLPVVKKAETHLVSGFTHRIKGCRQMVLCAKTTETWLFR